MVPSSYYFERKSSELYTSDLLCKHGLCRERDNETLRQLEQLNGEHDTIVRGITEHRTQIDKDIQSMVTSTIDPTIQEDLTQAGALAKDRKCANAVWELRGREEQYGTFVPTLISHREAIDLLHDPYNAKKEAISSLGSILQEQEQETFDIESALERRGITSVGGRQAQWPNAPVG